MNSKKLSKTQVKRHQKIAFIAVGTIVFLAVVGYTLFLISKSRTFQFFGGLTDRVHTKEKVIALTFDDAPTPYVNEVLATLKDGQVRATFYSAGSNIEQYPLTEKAIVEAGHEIGNHSYSHERIVLKPLSFIEDEIQKTNRLIRESGYTGEITFRPPNGKKLFLLPWYLNHIGMKTIMWDIEPDTYYPGDTKKIIRNVVDSAKPGAIILMHPLCAKKCEADRKALPSIIMELKNKGYTFVTVAQLLQLKRSRAN